MIYLRWYIVAVIGYFILNVSDKKCYDFIGIRSETAWSIGKNDV